MNKRLSLDVSLELTWTRISATAVWVEGEAWIVLVVMEILGTAYGGNEGRATVVSRQPVGQFYFDLAHGT